MGTERDNVRVVRTLHDTFYGLEFLPPHCGQGYGRAVLSSRCLVGAASLIDFLMILHNANLCGDGVEAFVTQLDFPPDSLDVVLHHDSCRGG